MSALYPTNDLGYLSVLLVFFRLLGLFVLVPGFSHSAISPTIKVLLALSVSLAVYPLVKGHLGLVSGSMASYFAAVIRETSVGLLMGFVALATFEAINLGAHFAGYQMGLGTVSMMDPENNAQVSPIVPFQTWVALMIFFFADMHHQVIQVFVESFRITQGLDSIGFGSPALLNVMMGITGKLFSLAVQLAAPITVMILSCNIVVGMLSRILPQMNILLFSFPITISLGFAALYIISPELLDSMESVLSEMSTEMLGLVRAL